MKLTTGTHFHHPAQRRPRGIEDRIQACALPVSVDLPVWTNLTDRGLSCLGWSDSWIAGTAYKHEATLIHKDPEFLKFKEIAQERLTC